MQETKKHSLIRYILLLIFIIVYIYYTVNKFGVNNGILVSALTWSFFVFCTPIADAGFLLAFPIRLLIGVRMLYTQLFSFFLALIITLGAVFYNQAIFQTTLILKLYYQILHNPYPYWIIIILSLVGTFFSIYFGDELIDVNDHHQRRLYHRHKNKHNIIVSASIFVLTVIIYDFLLHHIGVVIPLF